MTDKLSNATIESFLEKIIAEINSVGIDVSALTIDHIAYTVASKQEYERVKEEFLQSGKLVNEAPIKGRRVGILKLNTPVHYKTYEFSAVEVIEPVEGEPTPSCWEHVEFLIDNYDVFMQRYPNLNWLTKDMYRENFSRIKLILPSGLEVKFLNTPVLESANKEK